MVVESLSEPVTFAALTTGFTVAAFLWTWAVIKYRYAE